MLTIPISEAVVPSPPKTLDNPINKRYLLNEMNKLRLEFTDQEGGFLPIRKWVTEPLLPNVVYTNTSYGEEFISISANNVPEIILFVDYSTSPDGDDFKSMVAGRSLVATNLTALTSVGIIVNAGDRIRFTISGGNAATRKAEVRVLTSNYEGRTLF